MSAPPDRPEATSAPVVPARDDARRPRSVADRLRLFVILLVLPAAAVCIPTVVVSHFFGQHPALKEAPHTEGLQKTLEQSAQSLLPPPLALGPDPITVNARADRLDARLKKITNQAQALGGTASEGLSTATEKRLSVDLPAGQLEAFRQAVAANVMPRPLAVASAPAGRDYVDVIIQAAGDDE